MPIYILALAVAGLLAFGYFLYGRYLARFFRINDSVPTPACVMKDGVDYEPAKGTLLLGQHFSAISAAGPIVGPILAAAWFGWAPALIWIVVGSIFIGGVHDFASLVASIRHKAKSVGEIVKLHLPKRVYVLFLLFVWLSLVYVIIAFTDITSHTFKTVVLEGSASSAQGKGWGEGTAVAASSVLYLAIGMAMGVALLRFKVPLWAATAVALPLVFISIWAGPHMPEWMLRHMGMLSVKQWDMVILAYCLAASVLPAWLLLQPRGYLGGWLLYAVIIASAAGVLLGGYSVTYPAFNLQGLSSALNGKPIFPILFITIACGACSGFHAIVSSGTTSKQLCRESDAKPVAYGAMILEALVAFLALSTLIVFYSDPKAVAAKDPTAIYASGLAAFIDKFSFSAISYNAALSFALLAFCTFVYDTLDVCTRLGRIVFQELTGLNGKASHWIAAAATLTLPAVFLLLTKEKSYLVAWSVFGTSNQLLASLTLLMLSVWLARTGRNPLITLIPMCFMLVITVWSLILQIIPMGMLLSGNAPKGKEAEIATMGATSVLLLVLATWLVVETAMAFARPTPGASRTA